MSDQFFNSIPFCLCVQLRIRLRACVCVFILIFLSNNNVCVCLCVRQSRPSRRARKRETPQEYAMKSKFARLFTPSLPHIPYLRTLRDNVRRIYLIPITHKSRWAGMPLIQRVNGKWQEEPNQCPPGLATASSLFLFVNTSLFNITI